ncbi:MAG: hypothetical protein L6262_07265 [Weeksellaceae bacterium]|nr:hypothetical protein [Weeksellaceae bacterium]
MKIKLLLCLNLMFALLVSAQSKGDSPGEKKFYFPAAASGNSTDYDKNFSNLVAQIAPIDISEKAKRFSKMQKIFFCCRKIMPGQ